MTDDSPSALGPLFGPDFILITVNDENKTPYQLEIYPDANNPLLKSNGLAQQFYFDPQRIYVAKKQDSPADFDFGMTVFKGLMTSEDTVGITGPDVEASGGFCVFSTTFAIPDTVIANAIKALKNSQLDKPAPPRLFGFLDFTPSEPDPLLGIIPILSNDVTIGILQTGPAGSTSPIWMQAQSAQKGSLEATGISSFLVSANMEGAGIIAGSMQAGSPPFTVWYALTEQFYLPACEVDVTIDLDKTFDSFSAAVSGSGLFDSASFQYAYSNCATNGSIVTDMKINEAALPDDLKTMVMQQCQQMQQNAVNWVKDEIFDWQPTDGGQAQASNSSLLGSIFGGFSVSMKSTYQKRSMNVTQTLKLDTTISKSDTKSGDLTDLQPALKADLDKYLAIIDIGKYFQKIQVAATAKGINWSEVLPDGTNLADPITAAMIEVSYPDYDEPLDAQKNPNLKTLGQGDHYLAGSMTGQSGLAQWTKENPNDIINVSYLRLDQTIPQWPANQVQVSRTLIFDSNDPRVDLSNNQTQVVITTTDQNHTLDLNVDAVGYVFVRFMCRPLPAAVSLVINTTLGPRNDSITIVNTNQKSAIWEIFSDKYVAVSSFTYTVQVTVQGPNFTDNPIVYQSPQPITVALPPGRVKYNPLVNLQLPDAPPSQVTAINQYILHYQQQLAGTPV